MPENPGVGNRNCQIISSRAGLKLVEPYEYVIKARSDQIVWAHSMQKMYNYFCKHHAGHIIFTLGMYRQFPFHPRDHMFWGLAEDLQNLFDIPLDPTPSNTPVDYRKMLRAEAYIGQYYYLRHALNDVDKYKIKAMIECPHTYLYDDAPLLNEALGMDFLLRDSVFRPFPQIDMAWPKHGLLSYHYHIGASLSEYWGKDD